MSYLGNLCNDPQLSGYLQDNHEHSSELQETVNNQIEEQNHIQIQPLERQIFEQQSSDSDQLNKHEQNNIPVESVLSLSTCIGTPEKQKICQLSQSSNPNSEVKSLSPDSDSVSEKCLSSAIDSDSEKWFDSESEKGSSPVSSSFDVDVCDDDTISLCDTDCSSSSSSDSSIECNSETDDDKLSLTDGNIQVDIPEKEYQALSLLSCFLRNQFSASTIKDVIHTFKTTFKDSSNISELDFGQMMSYVDTSPVREVHYCIDCKHVFPDDKDVTLCRTANCNGLRYKGTLSNQQNKSRQPRQSFVFSDVEKQLMDLLKAPGIL